MEESGLNMILVVTASTAAFICLILNVAGVIFKFKICENKQQKKHAELTQTLDNKAFNDQKDRKINEKGVFKQFDTESSVVIDTEGQQN